MNPHFAMGIFALYVVVVSLARLLASREFPRLTAMKKAWGRSRGMLLHFLSNVALPLVLGIVFMSRGIVGIGSERAAIESDLSSWNAAICALTAPANVPAASPGGTCRDSAAPPLDPPDDLPQSADAHGLPIFPP